MADKQTAGRNDAPEPEFKMPGSEEDEGRHHRPPNDLGELVDDDRGRGLGRGGGSMEPMTGSNAGPRLDGV